MPRLRPVSFRVLCLLAAGISAVAQQDRTTSKPGSSYRLYQVPSQSSTNHGPELWIENTRTGRRTFLLAISGTVNYQWASDGTAFVVNDQSSSDRASSYIYNAETLKRIDLEKQIRAADPDINRFTDAHLYFIVKKWETTQTVLVRFFGHTNIPPVLNFDYLYRVDRSGKVRKL